MNPASLVVDAIVAVKWVVTAEIFSAPARALLTDAYAARSVIVGPPHLPGEVANALHQRLVSRDPARHISADEAEQALRTFLTIPITLTTPAGLCEQEFALARRHALPGLYDALYVALAHFVGAGLWTTDERLLRALGTAAPWVRRLSTYPLH